MREQHRILELWQRLEVAGEPAVLATVVKTAGSSYRLPGARLLLARDGRRAGGVSGGCLEEDLVRKAWWLTESGAVIRKYDTTPDGEVATSGYGLGCNGIIYVLLERLIPGKVCVLDHLAAVYATRRPSTIAHVIAPEGLAGRRLILDTQGQYVNWLGDDGLAEQLSSRLSSSGDSAALRLEGGPEVFVERLQPPIRLLVFGAGDDAAPITRLAAELGWHVTVLDGRAHYARAEKFPAANEVIVRQAGAELPTLDPWTCAVIMSHSYSQDLDVLRLLADQPALPYLGILGPRNRTAQLLSESRCLENREYPGLHAPMGLDVGGEGPEQIAVAVVAEIQAVLHGRNGGFLRDRPTAIHGGQDRTGREDWVRSIVCA